MRPTDPVYWLFERLTRTKALDGCRGQSELAFFSPMHRVFYLAGLSTSDRGVRYRLYAAVVMLMITLFLILELWYLCSESSSLDVFIDNINVTIIHIITIYRYRSVLANSEVYNRLAVAMETEPFDVDTDNRRRLLASWIQKNTKYIKLLLGLGSCTLATWYLYPLFDDLEYNLPVVVKLPYDYQTPVLYPISYSAVLLAFHFISFFVIVNDIFMQSHLMHIICQFNLLADCFENIVKDCGCDDLKQGANLNQNELKEKFIKRLGHLVKQHTFIVQNTLELRYILSFPMLCQFLASSMLICFAGYQVTATIKLNMAKFLMSLLYLSYNMFALFIFCSWCDEIKIQSVSIAQAIYSSGWENGAGAWPGVRSRLILVMLRASKPLVISAGGLYDLSLESYSTLVKTSYSALTVLLRVRDE